MSDLAGIAERETAWELINPSDKFTFRTADFEALAFAIMLLSNGGFCVEELDVEHPRKSPIFAFGGDPEEWWQETFGHPIAAFSDASDHAARIISVLDSGVYGDRADYEAAVGAIDDSGKRDAFIADWSARHRSSMNDIGKAVRAWATKLRRALSKGSPDV